MRSENDGGASTAASAGEPGAERNRGQGRSALVQRIAAAKAEGRAALIGYLPVGYPDVPRSIEAMVALVEGGADAVEIGVPYSDPGMEGPVIQQAMDAPVRAGVGLRDVFGAVRAVAEAGAVPMVMSYWNPIERYGVERFAEDFAAAGGVGVITPDLIPDEAAAWLAASDATGLDRIFLVAPSSTDARLRSTVAACRGFVYAASTMGVTGTRATVGDAAERLVARTRAAITDVGTDLSVCVGLGVSNGDQAAEVAGFADGVIVGSAYVRELLEGRGPDGVRALSADLAAGVRRAGVRA